MKQSGTAIATFTGIYWSGEPQTLEASAANTALQLVLTTGIQPGTAVEGTFSSLAACGPGNFSTQSSGCQSCPLGTYRATTSAIPSCTACAIGGYSDQTGASLCKNCPAGTVGLRTGTTSASDCAYKRAFIKHPANTLMNRTLASQFCSSSMGFLASILSANENTLVNDLRSRGPTNETTVGWLDLVHLGQTLYQHVSNGENANYFNWDTVNPGSLVGSTSASSPSTTFSVMMQGGTWRHEGNNTALYLPLCTYYQCADANKFRAVAGPTNGNCTNMTVCNSTTQFERIPATWTTDRVCDNATAPCGPLGANFETAPLTATTNRQCAPVRLCDANLQFQSQAPTQTSDRVCGNLTACTLAQYTLTPSTATSNRVCANLTVCNASATFERVAPTPTSDRVCERKFAKT